jgi:hypothetical protein
MKAWPAPVEVSFSLCIARTTVSKSIFMPHLLTAVIRFGAYENGPLIVLCGAAWPSPATPSQRQEQTSFRFLRFLRLAQANSRASSILIDELDASSF